LQVKVFEVKALLALVVVGIVTSACSSQPQRPLEPDSTTRVSYEGFWELDLSQSDNIQARLDTLVRELQRRAERQSQSQRGSDRGAGVVVGSSGSNSGASIIGLARMAEMITGSQLLEIEQGKNDILIKREDTFSLDCEFYKGSSEPRKSLLGTEVCGWDSHQLLFRIFLPDGLSIQHRLSLGESGKRLNIATTVYSDRVSYPFTLNRVYNRYEPDRDGITCELTLTRGKVCTTESR